MALKAPLAPEDRVRRERRAAAAGLLAVAAICTVSILDPDLPWHLAAARGMLAAGAVPRVDFLSWTMAGKPWIDFEWGSELIFRGLQLFGGTAAMWLFRSAALFALALLFWSLLRLWKVPPLWRAVAVPALAASLFPLYGLRPEIFSTLLFMLELHLLERRRLGVLRLRLAPFVALHVVLYAAWANLHAGFPVGLVLCACYGAGELIEGREARVPAALLAGAAGFLGTFINPYGAGIYAVLLDHWRQLGLLRRVIVEWEPPSFGVRYLAGYWLLLGFSFLGLFLSLVRGGDLPGEHVVVIVFFGLFGARSVRTTKYVLLTVFPLATAAWSRLDLSPRRLRALALVGLLGVPFIAWRGYSWAGRLRFFGWPPPMEAQGPARAFAYLRAQKAALAGLKLYNPYNWG
ncbi:MAG TPA: hypothetical protein VH309_12700, partial [Elusimicrobiota bacterium]|nr:hypothetical protein [Elusimicrobiota bacterium]